MNVLLTILISVFIVLFSVFLLGFKVFFTKNGKFPNTHIGANKSLKNKGVTCATSQDQEARATKKIIEVNKFLKQID